MESQPIIHSVWPIGLPYGRQLACPAPCETLISCKVTLKKELALGSQVEVKRFSLGTNHDGWARGPAKALHERVEFVRLDGL